jgi:TRAP-type mannitol/chloroaromatic compound transport system permease small subunit
LQCCIGLIDSINEWIGRAVSWLTLVMVLVTFATVVLRYVFNVGWIAVQESVTYMHVMVFMLGAAYTLKQDGHVRVDIIYQRCSAKTQGWIDFFGALFLLMPVAGFILWSSWEYVDNSWAIHESSRNSGGLPGVYLIKTLIPVMAILLLLQGLSLAARSLMVGLGLTQVTSE